MLRYAFLLSAWIALGTGCNTPPVKKMPPIPPKARANAPAPIRPLAIPETKTPTAAEIAPPLEIPAKTSAIPKGDALPKDAIAQTDANLQIPPPPQVASLDRKPLAMPDIPLAPNAQPIEKPTTDLILPVSAAVTEFPAKRLYRTAKEQYDRIDSFEARLTRKEMIAGREQPKEMVRFQFRKKPLSVHMIWIGDEGRGREVLFVDGKYGGRMQVLPAKDDTFPLPPVRMAFLPDDPMVRSKSRHDIRHAGLGTAIEDLGRMLQQVEKQPALEKTLQYRGLTTRSEFPYKLETLEQQLLPGTDILLPRGGKRTFFFDTQKEAVSFGLPVLVITQDERGKEVEYYCFDRFIHPVRLDDEDFDAERMGKR